MVGERSRARGEKQASSRRIPSPGKEDWQPLAAGKDETGDCPIVRGGTISKSDLGYRLTADGEAFAVRPLDRPLTGTDQATFKLDYQARRRPPRATRCSASVPRRPMTGCGKLAG